MEEAVAFALFLVATGAVSVVIICTLEAEVRRLETIVAGQSDRLEKTTTRAAMFAEAAVETAQRAERVASTSRQVAESRPPTIVVVSPDGPPSTREPSRR